MKSGDRVFYQGEPVWVEDWQNVRYRERDAWVLIRFENGATRKVRARDLEPNRETT